MTGAYAQEWPGRGAWEHRDRCGGHHDDDRHGHGRGRSGRGGRGGRGGPGPEAIAALVAMAKGRGRGPLNPDDLEHIEQLIALRRMRGGGRGPWGRGGGPRGRGRRRRGDVRLAVLRLLAEEPRNGYQLIQTIEERSGGHWRPSPGSMYPTLSQLEDEALIRSADDADGGGRRFHITDAGRADLEQRSGEPDPWTPEPDADEHAMTELGPLVIGIGKATWQVASIGDESQRTRAVELLAETQRRLYGLLAEAPADGDADGGADRESTDDGDGAED